MEEQLISFETAKLAVEKGFAIASTTFFNEDFSIKSFEFHNIPTQSLLQKWLREEHQLYVTIVETHTYTLTTHIGFYGNVVKPSEGDDFDKHGFEYMKTLYASQWFCSTYEEALEEGLLEALKLIK